MNSLNDNCVHSETPKHHLFEERASETLNSAIDTFKKRGQKYGDTWRNGRWLTMAAVAKKLGYDIPFKHRRAIAAAVLVDTKHQRMEGGYDEDHLKDGINYSAFLASEMKKLSKNGKNVNLG